MEKPVELLEDGQNNLAIARTVLEDASKTDRLQLENRLPIESNLRWIFTMIDVTAWVCLVVLGVVFSRR